MAYNKQNFVDGQILKAEHLNNIENGFSNVEWTDLKNPPFYEDTSTGDVLLEETEIVGEMLDGEPAFIADLDPSLFRGDEIGLTITFDGSEYPCERKYFTGVPIFGNAVLVGGEDTGEPFMLVYYIAAGMCDFYLMDAEPHAISITVLNIERKKIENKFIDSEWLATYSSVNTALVAPGSPVNFNGSEEVVLQSVIGNAILDLTLDSLEVDWNGTIYTCPIMSFGPGVGIAGMNLAAGLVPSGEYPFGIFIQGPSIAVLPSAGYEGTTNVVSINLTAKLPNKIPPQFLPLVDTNNDYPGAMSPDDKRKLDSLKNVEAYTHPTHTSYSSGLYKISVNNLGHVSGATKVSKSDITALGIPAQDTTYTHPSYTSKASGLYKVTVDGTGHISAATAVSKSDITALGIPAQDTTYTHPSYTSKASGLYKVTVDSTGHISDATAVSKSDITALGIPAQDTTYSAATTSAAGLMSASDKTKLNGVVSVPASTTSDNGKFLRVVNGSATWTTVSSAEGASF